MEIDRMKKNLVLFLLTMGVAISAIAAEDLVLNTQQKQTLGIKTVVLPPKQQGELAGMPALVVIPANQLFTVSTPLSAMVEQTLVGVGDTVSRGQVLATLQSPALVEAQRGLLQAATQMQLAQDNMARDEKLWQDGIISESRFRATQSQYRETSAAFNERKQVLRLAGLSDEAITKLQTEGNLNSLLSVVSPISGVILEKTASAGQRLDAAVSLFKVAKLDPLGLEIQAPLAKTQGLKVGATVNVTGYAASGKLTAIGHSLSGGNQTILLRALINKGAQNLRPGQYLEATLDTQTQNPHQWSVPNAALSRVGGKTILFVDTANGFRSVVVTVLHEGNQNSLISGKLNGLDAVAVQGVSALKAQLMGIGGTQ
jgi:RND family efflux transporter MFP subunit